MTRLQKLQLRQSEVRVSLGTLLDTPEAERTDTYADDLSKLTTEVRSLETDVGAAIAAGDDKVAEVATKDTPEGKEYREMETRANVGELFDCVLSHGQPDGAIAELQKHLGLGTNQIPLGLISGYGKAEERAVTRQRLPTWARISKASYLTSSRSLRRPSWVWTPRPWELVKRFSRS